MPNPKTGTVTMDVTKAVKDITRAARSSSVSTRNHNLSFLIGKMSFDESALDENFKGCGRRSQASEAVHREGPLPDQGNHHLHDEPGRSG